MAGSRPLLAPLLAIEALTVGFATEAGRMTAVDGIDLAVPAGRTLGLVGESGSGKSVTALAIMGLLPGGCTVAGAIRLAGEDLVSAGEARRTALRGDRMGMVFQEPMTALNPAMTIGTQVAETLRLHRGMGAREAADAAEAMLSRVGISAAKARAAAYPHHLSGGMRQRALIAMALICRPSLLIADEPTTALDVTVQAQILDLMLEMQAEIGMGILFISHDLGVISEVADEVAVMYAGRIVERGPADAIFRAPRHPYTKSLLAAVPVVGEAGSVPPSRFNGAGTAVAATERPATGCRFADRCAVVMPSCRVADPQPVATADGHVVACLRSAP